MIKQGFYYFEISRQRKTGQDIRLPVHVSLKGVYVMSENRLIQITSSDSLHTYGSIGVMDYTVRLCIRLDSVIDGEVLKAALESTQKRYPYLKLRMKRQGADL